MIKRLGGEVIVESLEPLLGLFQQVREIDRLVEASPDGRPTVDFDLFAFALDLPGIFNTELDSIPANIPYLYADIDKANAWRRRIACPDFKIGIVWAGSARHTNDHNRSCALSHFLTLQTIPGLRLFSLQKGPAQSALHDPAFHFIHDMAHLLHDFSDTSAAIENMDLVISVDTAVLHLAGAMGKDEAHRITSHEGIGAGDHVEASAERVLTQHADNERRLGVWESPGRPADVSPEIVEIRRLDRVFPVDRLISAGLRRQARRPAGNHGRENGA